MKLEFQGKSLTYNMDGGHLPVVLPGDKTALSNQELFALAMGQHWSISGRELGGAG